MWRDRRRDLRLTLHIGATKTGSSALQAHLYEGRGLLAERGILYPDIGVVSNAHHLLLAAIHPGAWRLHRDALPADGSARVDRFHRMMEQIGEEARKTEATHVVLSSEYLWGRLPPPLVKVLAEALAPYETRVVAILRRQDAWFEASYLQAIKSGLAIDFDAWIEQRLATPLRGGGDAAAVLEFWEGAIAPAALAVRPYEFEDRTRFTAEALDLVCDDTVGRAIVGAEAKFVNPSPNRAGLSALLEVNRRAREAAEDRKTAARTILSRMTRPERSGEAIVLTPQRAAGLMESFAASNRRLAERFGDGTRDTYFDLSDLRASADQRS